MTLGRAFTVFIAAVVLVEIAVICGMKALGADSETIASVYVLLLSGAGLGGGFIFMRYS